MHISTLQALINPAIKKTFWFCCSNIFQNCPTAELCVCEYMHVTSGMSSECGAWGTIWQVLAWDLDHLAQEWPGTAPLYKGRRETEKTATNSGSSVGHCSS